MVKSLYASIGDWAIQLLGFAEAFILQGYINVQYGYRMFIVDGRPVTGAASNPLLVTEGLVR